VVVQADSNGPARNEHPTLIEADMSQHGFLPKSLGAVSLAVLSAPLLAANLWFARDMPISAMNDADLSIMSAAIEETLGKVPDGDTRDWSNPETGSGGTLRPLSTSEHDGNLCRRLEVSNQARGRSARSVHDYCRQADGSWRLQATPSPAGSGNR
jgi:hypothetical protein